MKKIFLSVPLFSSRISIVIRRMTNLIRHFGSQGVVNASFRAGAKNGKQQARIQ